MSIPPKIPPSLIPISGQPGSYVWKPLFTIPPENVTPAQTKEERIKILDDKIWGTGDEEDKWAVGENGLIYRSDPSRKAFKIFPEKLNSVLSAAADVGKHSWKELTVGEDVQGVMDCTRETEVLTLYDRKLHLSNICEMFSAREFFGYDAGGCRLVILSRNPANAAHIVVNGKLLEILHKNGACESIIPPPLYSLLNENPLSKQALFIHEGNYNAVLPNDGKLHYWSPVLLPWFLDMARAVLHMQNLKYNLLSLQPNQFVMKSGTGNIKLAFVMGGKASEIITLNNSKFRENPFGMHNPGCVPAADPDAITRLMADNAVSPEKKNAQLLRIIQATNAHVLGCALAQLIVRSEFFIDHPKIMGKEVSPYCPAKYANNYYLANKNENWDQLLIDIKVPLDVLKLLRGLLADKWEVRTSIEDAFHYIEQLALEAAIKRRKPGF